MQTAEVKTLNLSIRIYDSELEILEEVESGCFAELRYLTSENFSLERLESGIRASLNLRHLHKGAFVDATITTFAPCSNQVESEEFFAWSACYGRNYKFGPVEAFIDRI